MHWCKGEFLYVGWVMKMRSIEDEVSTLGGILVPKVLSVVVVDASGVVLSGLF